MNPNILHENSERNYSVRLVPCVITKQFDKCISIKLGEIEPVDEEGLPTGKTLEVFGQFSQAGLMELLSRLQEAPPPIELPTPTEIRLNNPYQWMVQFQDGEWRQQYNDGEETLFSGIHLPDVKEFWVVPVEGAPDLPSFGLVEGRGFLRVHGDEFQYLDLPWPNETWNWQYYRRNTITFNSYAGNTGHLPEHVLQVLGWRIIDDDGTEIRLEIGIEADGTWQIYKQEPYDHPAFVKPEREPEQIIAKNGVVIVDMVERVEV